MAKVSIKEAATSTSRLAVSDPKTDRICASGFPQLINDREKMSTYASVHFPSDVTYNKVWEAYTRITLRNPTQ
jgi:hypothetical protein